jgi:hypothetical protein
MVLSRGLTALPAGDAGGVIPRWAQVGIIAAAFLAIGALLWSWRRKDREFHLRRAEHEGESEPPDFSRLETGEPSAPIGPADDATSDDRAE